MEDKLWTNSFMALITASFLMFFSYYMLMAVLPIYVVDILNKSSISAGIILTVFIIGSTIARFFIGNCLDSFDRRILLLISSVLFLIANLLYYGAQTFESLLLLRIFHGCTYGMMTTTLSTITAEVVPSSRKGEGIGYYGTGMSLGMVLGPFGGLYIFSNWGVHELFLIATVSSFLTFLIGMLVQVPRMNKEGKIKRKIKFFERAVLKISFIAFLLALGYCSISSFLSLYTEAMNEPYASGYFFLCYGAAMIISRPVIGKIFDKVQGKKIITVSYFVYICGMLLLSYSSSYVDFCIAGLLLGIGFGSVFSCLQTIMVNSVNSSALGTANSTYYLFFDSGIALGSCLLGLLVNILGFQWMFRISSLIIFYSFLFFYLFFIRQTNVLRKNKGKERDSSLN
ncbi:MFS transporter [Bacillus velezensis]|uniref:MFS transporter n=1 Tax=Bacillus velezensis TaxID=492670 RepID=UPI003D7F4D1C